MKRWKSARIIAYTVKPTFPIKASNAAQTRNQEKRIIAIVFIVF